MNFNFFVNLISSTISPNFTFISDFSIFSIKKDSFVVLMIFLGSSSFKNSIPWISLYNLIIGELLYIIWKDSKYFNRFFINYRYNNILHFPKINIKFYLDFSFMNNFKGYAIIFINICSKMTWIFQYLLLWTKIIYCII